MCRRLLRFNGKKTNNPVKHRSKLWIHSTPRNAHGSHISTWNSICLHWSWVKVKWKRPWIDTHLLGGRKTSKERLMILFTLFQVMEKMCLKETNIHTAHPDSHSVLMWTSLSQHWLGQLLLVTVISLATMWSVHCGSCRGIYSSYSAFSLIVMVEGLSFKVPPFFRRSVMFLFFFFPLKSEYPHGASWREACEHSEKYHSFWTIQTPPSAPHL